MMMIVEIFSKIRKSMEITISSVSQLSALLRWIKSMICLMVAIRVVPGSILTTETLEYKDLHMS
jgi:hypothetical protein